MNIESTIILAMGMLIAGLVLQCLSQLFASDSRNL